MNFKPYLGAALLTSVLLANPAFASKDSDTAALFHHAGQSAHYFDTSYGYAVFPTIGKAGLVVGAARGTGHVYVHGKRIGRTTVTQLSVGFQAGGAAYSQIIFFADKSALDEFTQGNFEFSADVGAIAITAAASASAGTSGTDAAASAGKHDAATAGQYNHGVAVFTIAKGGLMYEAKLAGQKYTFEKPSNH